MTTKTNSKSSLVSKYRFLTKSSVRHLHSFSETAACMGQTLRTRFPGTDINKLIVQTVFYCHLEHVNRRISSSLIKFAHPFFCFLKFRLL
jgi:hypothetical protein